MDIVGMLPMRICAGCEPLLNKAVIAMRHHVTEMDTAFYWLRKGNAAYEERQQEVSGWLVQSLQEAQAAWDEYCEHLKEHGLKQVGPRLI